MQNFYLIDYFKKNSNLHPELLDCLKYEIDQNIYYYGNQFKHPKEINSRNVFKKIRSPLKQLFILSKIIKHSKRISGNKIILSNAYFSVNEELKKLNYDVYCPSWTMSGDRNVLCDMELLFLSEHIKSRIQHGDFNEIIADKFVSQITKLERKLKSFFITSKLNALIVPNDMGFFERLSIRVCKEIGIPTFVFLHGLPGRYNSMDDNGADYLIVWGEAVKKNYINAGVDPNKIVVSGHPYYKTFKSSDLRFSLDNILIITKAMPGSQHSDKVRLCDRGNLILYLYSIEKVLNKFGVKSVRVRPHPSENAKWYLKFINKDFYKIDDRPLVDSIQNSSLIIGPMSTVFLESFVYGVNYTVYEITKDNIDILNNTVVPPFDGLTPGVPVAKNEDELYMLIKNKDKVNTSFFSEYIKTPFDINFIKEIV